MIGSKFSAKDGTVNHHPTKGTHWIAYTNEIFFDFFRCRTPNLFPGLILRRNGECVLTG